MDLLSSFYAALAALAVCQASLMLLQAYEHRRFFHRRARRELTGLFNPRVELVIPCKGVDPEFDLLVKELLGQDYPAYGVTFVVESMDDPAWQSLEPLLGCPQPVPVRLLAAGQALDCGQKIQNLLVGTAALDPAVEVIAFLDADVRVTSRWLRLVVEPLQKPDTGAVTGYRWFVPYRNDWPNAVLSALNAPVAFALGNHRWNAIWGGSWSVRRSTFELAAVRQAWQGALTEDYPAWKAIRKTGLRVVFEPGCLLASPVQCTWNTLFEFGRRQYLITRVYAPGLWWLALLGELLFSVTFWGGLTLEAERWLAREGVTWISLALVTLYGLAALRARVRQSVARVAFPAWHDALRRSRVLDIWARPFLALCNLGLILASAFGRRITWRGIRYQLDGPEQTRVLSYRPAPGRPE